MIVIIDYGLGNLCSIANMLKKVGQEAVISGDPRAIAAADKIILPGVGAFDNGMKNLEERGILPILNEQVTHMCVPVLGICLGMHLMGKSSEEGKLPGLGWINAEIMRFKVSIDSKLKIPHMGWNTVSVVKSNPLININEVEQRFYFVHSYHAVCMNPEDVLATTCHGYDVTAAFSHENIFGVQFHPEKSHRFGMTLMKIFVEL